MIQKQPIDISFAKGLDTKTDPFRIQIGNFQSLENSIFTKGGLLQKRNGFGSLTNLPNTDAAFITTFNGNLTAIGTELQAYAQSTNTWINKGNIQPTQISTMPLIRNNGSQTQADTAISSSGLVCIVYTEVFGGTTTYKYAVYELATGQSVINPTLLAGTGGAVTGSPRVFLLGNYFFIAFTVTIGGTSHLQYIALSTFSNAMATAPTDITSVYTPSARVAWDGVVTNNSLYIAWNGADAAVHVTSFDSHLNRQATVAFAGQQGTMFTMAADETGGSPVIYVAFYSPGGTGRILAVNQIVSTVLAPTSLGISGAITALNLASTAQNGACDLVYEVSNVYPSNSVQTNYINKIHITQAGVVSASTLVDRSVGLASKAFLINGTMYFLTAYSSTFQPSYFLLNLNGNVVAKLAYSNGGGYLGLGLPSVAITGTEGQVAYLFKDLISSVNKTQGVANAAGVYSQTGINLATFNLTTSALDTTEIGNDLLLNGGFLWMYDGDAPVETNFFVWPDNVNSPSNSTLGGSMSAQIYFYQVIYQWTDNQGNAFESAPSIPLEVDLSGSGTSTNSVVLKIPTLRLTYKTTNPVKISIYRWSTANQVYYETTSILNPLLNDVTVDEVTFTDTHSDASIIGNALIYTTGGVVEDISPPGCTALALFNSRLFLVDAEDQNLLWYSKQVIENTPVEMSDLFTIFIAPTTAAQGSTGPITALCPLDDALIIFKKNAILYINGSGPDNTGANSQFSEPIFITSTVGCVNQQSIVFTPQGLLFQSDKGIWLIDRSNKQTSYLGAPVESFTQNAKVKSALNIPGTNQVRFTLDSGVTLMYDYYYNQWGTFTNIPGLSSTLYQDLHTYIDKFGRVFQETDGLYLDGTNAVLLSFTTGWINPAGLQGYQRSYFFYLLGTYITPHFLQLQIAYDYQSSPLQTTMIKPTNFTPTYGLPSPYGQGSPYGGPGDLEQWRIFLARQRCQAFQITLNEVYDSTLGVAAGAGLTISGLNLVVGMKKGYYPASAAQSAGGGS